MSSSVQLEHLKKIFIDSKTKRTVAAVEDFSLNVAPGELVTLLGPSGCGKTTVLRMLGGFESPSLGEIRVDGHRVNELPPNARNSAMVFQSYALFPHMSVIENIAYGLKLRGIKGEEREKKLQRIVEVVGLKGYELRRPNELSGGQQQRVALARALVIEPALLLFDEPLSNLDAKLRIFMRNEIRDLQKRLGITAVYVTHDQEEAMAISDRVVVMNKGRIEQIGSPKEVYERPKTVFVADFMGSANIIPAALRNWNSHFVDAIIGGRAFHIEADPEILRKSEKALAVVRPEAIRLSPHSSPSSIQAKIRGHHYLGGQDEYDLELPTGESLKAKVPSSLEISETAEVYVEIPAESISLHPAP